MRCLQEYTRPHNCVLSTSSKCNEMSNHLSQLRHSLWGKRKRDRKDKVYFCRCVYAWNLVASCAVVKSHSCWSCCWRDTSWPDRFMADRFIRAILIFLITLTTTWLFASYLYTTRTQKAETISEKNLSFNWVHSLHKGSMNASHSTDLFTNSCDHISTNGKAPLHSHINLQRRANARKVSFLNLSLW